MVGWILSLAPLIALNALSLSSGAVDPSSTALAGAGALAAGVALGGLSAGMIGGRRGGAIAGAIAGALCAFSLIGLMYYLRAQGSLPDIVTLHPVRTLLALLFLGALVACIALGVGALLGLRATRAEAKAVAAFAAARQSGPRPSGDPRDTAANGNDQARYSPRDSAPYVRKESSREPDARRGQPMSAPRQPPQSDRRPAAARYDARQDARYERGYDSRYESRQRGPEAPDQW